MAYLHYRYLLKFFPLAALVAVAACQTAPGNRASLSNPVNVRQYGATGDGKHLDNQAINRAITDCAAAGGGTVYVPAGKYLCGSIRMRSNINLMLDAGATIVGAPQNLHAYDPPEEFDAVAYQDGGHTYFHNSLIWGENLTNVSITGTGTIHGGGLTRRDRKPGLGSLDLGDKAIALKNCHNVLMRDVTILHGGHFAILATGCDLMTIDNLTIDTDRDGMDIDCCQNVMVSNCRVNSPGDDAICPKSSFALGKNVICENLTITNCQVSGFAEGTLVDGTMKPSKVRNGRIKLGTESNGGFRNIAISNCTFRMCRGLALEEVDGGIMENITISNIVMTDVAHYPIYIRLGNRNRGPNVNEPGVARDILITNVVASGIDPLSGIQITSLPGAMIERVRLDNIHLLFKGGGTDKDAGRMAPELTNGYPEPEKVGPMPAYGVFARHVKGLELSNIWMDYAKSERRPAMVCVDVDGLEIDNFKARVEEGVTPARFEATPTRVIRNSPVLDKSVIQETATEPPLMAPSTQPSTQP